MSKCSENWYNLHVYKKNLFDRYFYSDFDYSELTYEWVLNIFSFFSFNK